MRESAKFSVVMFCPNVTSSAVAFKNGALRVVLDNGWHLNIRAAGPFVPASVTSGDEVIWTRSGG